MSVALNILFLGDVMGRAGRESIVSHLFEFKEKNNIDFVVANVENAAGGRGITANIVQDLATAGVNVFTLGDHTFDQKGTDALLAKDKRILRPANYPYGTPGRGFSIFEHKGKKIAVLNLIGRTFMRDLLDCPFQYSKAIMREQAMGDDFDALIVDIHCEATSEKQAMGHVWDGKASLVVGTHTHVPTADERIQPNGTGLHTDAGMCGDYNSIIGSTPETAVPRFERKICPKMEVATGAGTMCGTLVALNQKGLCVAIRGVRIGGSLHQSES